MCALCIALVHVGVAECYLLVLGSQVLEGAGIRQGRHSLNSPLGLFKAALKGQVKLTQ